MTSLGPTSVTSDDMVTVTITSYCYDLKLKVLSNKTTLVLSNTRKLDRVSSTK